MSYESQPELLIDMLRVENFRIKKVANKVLLAKEEIEALKNEYASLRNPSNDNRTCTRRKSIC